MDGEMGNRPGGAAEVGGSGRPAPQVSFFVPVGQ